MGCGVERYCMRGGADVFEGETGCERAAMCVPGSGGGGDCGVPDGMEGRRDLGEGVYRGVHAADKAGVGKA